MFRTSRTASSAWLTTSEDHLEDVSHAYPNGSLPKRAQRIILARLHPVRRADVAVQRPAVVVKGAVADIRAQVAQPRSDQQDVCAVRELDEVDVRSDRDDEAAAKRRAS